MQVDRRVVRGRRQVGSRGWLQASLLKGPSASGGPTTRCSSKCASCHWRSSSTSSTSATRSLGNISGWRPMWGDGPIGFERCQGGSMALCTMIHSPRFDGSMRRQPLSYRRPTTELLQFSVRPLPRAAAARSLAATHLGREGSAPPQLLQI